MNAVEKHLYEKGRRDGLEEAAKKFDLYVDQKGNAGNVLIGIAVIQGMIRDLKEKP